MVFRLVAIYTHRSTTPQTTRSDLINSAKTGKSGVLKNPASCLSPVSHPLRKKRPTPVPHPLFRPNQTACSLPATSHQCGASVRMARREGRLGWMASSLRVSTEGDSRDPSGDMPLGPSFLWKPSFRGLLLLMFVCVCGA